MSVRGGPNVVTNGLAFCMDAASTKSLVSGAPVWIDLVAGVTGVLFSGAAYSGLNAGSMAFPGGGSRVLVGPSGLYAFGTGEYAIETWVRPNTASTQYNLIDFRSQTVTLETCPVLFLTSASEPALFFNGVITHGVTTAQASVWSHLVVTRTGTATTIYLNGATNVVLANDTNSYSAAGFCIGASPLTRGAELQGAIGIVRLYSGNGLTINQAQQNYNAERGRFGIGP